MVRHSWSSLESHGRGGCLHGGRLPAGRSLESIDQWWMTPGSGLFGIGDAGVDTPARSILLHAPPPPPAACAAMAQPQCIITARSSTVSSSSSFVPLAGGRRRRPMDMVCTLIYIYIYTLNYSTNSLSSCVCPSVWSFSCRFLHIYTRCIMRLCRSIAGWSRGKRKPRVNWSALASDGRCEAELGVNGQQYLGSAWMTNRSIDDCHQHNWGPLNKFRLRFIGLNF